MSTSDENFDAPGPHDAAGVPDDLFGPGDGAAGPGSPAEDHGDDDLDDDIDPRHLAPLVVDAQPLHELVTTLTAALHDYVDTAVGVRAEFDSATAEDDPRMEVVEDRIAQINSALAEAFEKQLGLVSGHTTEAWDEDDADDDEDVDDDGTATFELSFTVAPTELVAPDIDAAFAVVESAGEDAVRRLYASGFEVREWGVSRDLFEDVDDDDEDDEE